MVIQKLLDHLQRELRKNKASKELTIPGNILMKVEFTEIEHPPLKIDKSLKNMHNKLLLNISTNRTSKIIHQRILL